jgi:hypothetical protein
MAALREEIRWPTARRVRDSKLAVKAAMSVATGEE